MLGSVKDKNSWIWYASGKHPAVKDYFKVGWEEPRLKAFATWIEDGYRQLSAGNDKKVGQNSWRFWAKGSYKMHLICGVGRDSFDSIGRSFPLVIMGTGRLRNWESRWDLLPVALDQIWHQIEHVCTKRFLDFKHLADDIQLMRSPVEKWTELNTAGQRAAHYPVNSMPTDAERMALQKSLSRRQNPLLGIIPLSHVAQEEQPREIALLHSMLKERSREVPNAVFMGGVPEKTCLVMFGKPLQPDDFSKLWSACSEV